MIISTLARCTMKYSSKIKSHHGQYKINFESLCHGRMIVGDNETDNYLIPFRILIYVF